MPTKVQLVKAMVFPVVMYGCESWTIKKAECQRIDAFELWCWRRFLRVLWAARRSNQSILKEINPEYSLKGLMLKLQYFGHGCEELTLKKKPDAGKDWGLKKKRATEDEMFGWRHRLSHYEFELTLGTLWRTGKPGALPSMRVTKSWTRQQLNKNKKTRTFLRRETGAGEWRRLWGTRVKPALQLGTEASMWKESPKPDRNFLVSSPALQFSL